MAVLGLRFCARAFSSCGKWAPLFIAVRGPLTITASLVAEHRLQTRRLSNCGSRAQLLRGVWDLPRPGLEPTRQVLNHCATREAPPGRFLTTAPLGKPPCLFFSMSSNILYNLFILFIVHFPLLECRLHEDRDVCLLFPVISPNSWPI